jgi:hypothetical protein
MIYNIDYYDNYLKNYSDTARLINEIRWGFVEVVNAKTILDFGSGVGWFRAFKPDNVRVDTFDIMPVFQTGITLESYDMATFWDSFEHTLQCDHIIKMADWIALTVPVCYNGNMETWKHNKPKEHLRLFKDDSEVEEYFNNLGMVLVKKGMPECPPREDITSFLFRKE